MTTEPTLYQLETARLLLRQWGDSDYAPFAAMNADAEVMAHFPALLTTAASNALADRVRNELAAQGYGVWALADRQQDQFMGCVGLQAVTGFPFPDSIEIAWRLAKPFWGNGYATEAALAVRYFTFEYLKQDELVAYTTKNNNRSMAVMQRIGMEYTGLIFAHPRIEPESRLSEHVLYKISRPAYEASQQLLATAPRVVQEKTA